MLINTSQYVPLKLKLSFDHCNRKQGIATFGVSSQSGNSSYIGALSLITSSNFDNFTLFDLSRSSENVRLSNNSLCVNLNQFECSNIQIMDSIIVNSHLFTLTTMGLFISSSFILQTNTASSTAFKQIFPLTNDFSFMNFTRIFGKSDCLDSYQHLVYLIYYNTSSHLLYGEVGDLSASLNPNWNSVAVSDISGIENNSVFFSAFRDVINQRHVYLVGNPLFGNDQIACSGNSSCLIDHASVVLDEGNGSPKLTFNFSSDLKVAGMDFQSKTNNIFVFGSEVINTLLKIDLDFF